MSAKRKAPVLAAEEPDAKKQRLQDGEAETPEGTTTVGQGFIAQLKQSRDKRSRLISTNFLTLPDKVKLPAYYDAIVLPLAIDTIEEKLNKRQYPTLTTLESDLKRMVSNAKSFNERNSEIFRDAEKVRKMVSNHMMKLNPAYKDGSGYTPFPTPLPGDKPLKREGDVEVDAEGETDPDIVDKSRRTVALHGPLADQDSFKQRANSTPAALDAADAGEGFDGNNFQQAQEKIITELIQLKNGEGEMISGPFLNRPSRELRDYYRVIKRPVCLRGVQKQVSGVKGRDKPTGVSQFKSWHAFEEETRNIWINARVYNEDGSEIFELANEFETYFNRRMAEARATVPEPAQPKVKLRMSAKTPEPPHKVHEIPPKITLRFGQKTPHDNLSGVAVDSEALKRQQDLVRAGANGHTASSSISASATPAKNPFGGSTTALETASIPPLNQIPRNTRSISAVSPPIMANGVKNEAHLIQSPALSATAALHRPSSSLNDMVQNSLRTATNMLPPSHVTPRLKSGSPHPQLNPTSHSQPASNPVDPRWRPLGKDASDALITNLNIVTHPALKIDQHFRFDVPASSTACQQSITINLPATHSYLQFTPTIASNLIHRPTKMFFTVNNQRLNPTPTRSGETDLCRPLYDVRVRGGITNRIEVELVAGPPRGVLKTGMGQDTELEKISVYINVLSF